MDPDRTEALAAADPAVPVVPVSVEAPAASVDVAVALAVPVAAVPVAVDAATPAT